MTPLCTVAASGWQSGGAADDVAFAAKGQVLSTELRRWQADEWGEFAGPEEVGAVLEGCFSLRCGDEYYELAAGQGILVPAGEAHCWRVLSGTGVLYRVLGPENKDLSP